MSNDAELLADEVRKFNTEIVAATPEGALAKVVHEAAEYVEKPTIYEAADVLITLVGAVQLHGGTWEELVEQALAKMFVNIYERTWTRQDDGSFQHD